MSTRTVLSWSGGKDSAMALHALRADPDVELVALLTTVSEENGRVAMHAVRGELVAAQARALGLRLERVPLPHRPPNEVYEERVIAALRRLATEEDVEAVAHGDLFLEDIRAYREGVLARAGLRPVFPVWGSDTADFMDRFLALGFRATVVCVDPAQLDPSFCGREVDAGFVDDLPAGADPAGENGEFHTFVHDGPGFATPVAVVAGEVVERDGFVFRDLLPG